MKLLSIVGRLAVEAGQPVVHWTYWLPSLPSLNQRSCNSSDQSSVA